MKYPINIRESIGEVERIISEWPVEIELSKVIKWILQFDNEDYDLAIRIIRNLNVIGTVDLDDSLEVALSKLMRKAIERGTKITNRNTIFAGMGNDGKSGSMISYHFRLINELSEENFLSEESIKYFEEGLIENIVLIDDILSSGRQASKAIRIITEKFTPFGVINIFVLTVCGFRDGIRKVEEETKAYVFSAYEYGIEDTFNSLDSKFYEGVPYERRLFIQEKMKRYGEICSPKMPTGYANIGALIVFYYNTPNTTTPLVWSSMNGWIPLFNRSMRINGIESYYKQISNKSVKKVKNDTKSMNELIIYTEGKRDEAILDILLSDYGLSERLDFQKVSIISLGGGFYSKKLFEKLSDIDGNIIFVFDDDLRKRDTNIIYSEMPVVYLEPSIMQFIDVGLLMKNDSKLRERFIAKALFKITEEELPSSDTQQLDIELDLIQIERVLFGRTSVSSNSLRIRDIIHTCFNEKGYEKFIDDIRKVLIAKKEKQQ